MVQEIENLDMETSGIQEIETGLSELLLSVGTDPWGELKIARISGSIVWSKPASTMAGRFQGEQLCASFLISNPQF